METNKIIKARPDLNKLAKEIFEMNKAKGFNNKEISNKTYLMLVITELSEAVEAHRKSKKFSMEEYEYQTMIECQGWLTPEKKFINVFERVVKDTIEDELADTIIRLLDYAGRYSDDREHPFNIDLSKADGRNVSVDREVSFPDKIYEIVSWLTTDHGSYLGYVSTGIFLVEHLCSQLSIDIWLHMELKLQYNQSRPYKHEKEY